MQSGIMYILDIKICAPILPPKINNFTYFFSLFFISWRLITLQYCSGFCHTLTWISHGFSYMKIRVKFYSVKNGILYILHMKMSVLSLHHEVLNFLFHFMTICMLNFLHEISYFLYFIYENLGGDPYIKYGNLYISQMKTMALVFFRYGEPMWHWNYLYFTNENMCTTVFSWHIKFFVFLIS